VGCRCWNRTTRTARPVTGGVAAAAGLFVALSATAAQAVELPEAFQGRWVAAGTCDDGNDVQGGLVTLGPGGLTGAGLACTFSGIREIADPQNRRFAMARTCESGGKTSTASIDLYLVESGVVGDVLVSVLADGSFLTLYRRCN